MAAEIARAPSENLLEPISTWARSNNLRISVEEKDRDPSERWELSIDGFQGRPDAASLYEQLEAVAEDAGFKWIGSECVYQEDAHGNKGRVAA